MNTNTQEEDKSYQFIHKQENVFGYRDDEKMKGECIRSPKRGITFVKIYNPYTSNGLFLHYNHRTKYMRFNCRFYKAPMLPKMFENIKTHILELPLLTAFNVYKKALKRNKITEDREIYCIIYNYGKKYDYIIKILKKECFFLYLEFNQGEYKHFRLALKGKSKELKIEELEEPKSLLKPEMTQKEIRELQDKIL